MSPDWKQRITSKLGGLTDKTLFRIVVAALFVSFHLLMFSRAGHDRIGVPFNMYPDERPYFSDPDAPATLGYPRQPHRWSRLVVSRLDAQHYIGTAIRNFTACPTDPNVPDHEYLNCGLGWLPAYGLVGGAVSQVTGLADDYALMLLSLLCAILINLMWISPTLVKRLGKVEAYTTLIAFNVYPAAFYVVTPYTEAATLALALGGFLALAKERWVLSAVLIGASTSLRIMSAALSVGLGCALLVAAWQRRKAGTKQWWRPLIAAPLCGWGQIATMIALKISVGDFWAFFRAREAFGDDREWGRLFDVQYYIRGLTGQNLDVFVLFCVIAIVVLTGRDVLKKFNDVERTYLIVGSVLTVILTIVAPLQTWGMTRYLMLCPIIYFAIAELVNRHLVLLVLWLFLGAAIYWHVELCGYITQGNPMQCPCLGRLEFGMPFGS